MGVNNVYRQTLEYQEGRNAYCDGVHRGQNPYSAGTDGSKAHCWWLGWDDEEAENESSEDDELPQGPIDRWRDRVEDHTGVKMTREQAVELAATIIMSPKQPPNKAINADPKSGSAGSLAKGVG